MTRKLVSTATVALGLGLLLLLLLQHPAAGGTPQGSSATILCVNKSGSGGCYTVIQDAINAGAALTDSVTINVDTGTYYEHITMADGVSIYGQGWGSTIIDGGHSQPTSVVYFPPGVSAATVLSGVQVTGGGNRSTSTLQEGGGIKVLYSSPTIVNTWVNSCTARFGGGVYASHGSPTFDNVPVWSSRAEYGGGYYLQSAGQPSIVGDPFAGPTNGTVLWNTATIEGGGVYVLQSEVWMSGMRLYGNTASRGGGVYVNNGSTPLTLVLNDISGNSSTSTSVAGGGIYSYDSSNLVIGLNFIMNNTSVGDGAGAVFSQSGGLIQWNQFVENVSSGGLGGGVTVFGTSADLVLQGNLFRKNSAGAGGGMSLDSGAMPLINANSFFSNTSVGIGGGIYMYQAGPVNITNNIIARNTAPGAGGGIGVVESPARIINNTISDNLGSDGDGVWFSGAENIAIINNIITGNSNDGVELYIYNGPTTNYTVDYNNTYNNTLLDYRNLTPGGHGTAYDPQFVGSGPTLTDYYHIQVSSPVSETGSVSWAPIRDIDHDLRTLDGSVSMGADEIPSTVYSVYLPLGLRNY